MLLLVLLSYRPFKQTYGSVNFDDSLCLNMVYFFALLCRLIQKFPGRQWVIDDR